MNTPNIQKIVEHTYGSHIYMRISVDGKQEEIDLYLQKNGEQIYKTTATNPEYNDFLIKCFNDLY